MQNKIILTQEGFNNLKNELETIINTKRGQAIERLRKAREMGDLSENSEYAAAKEDLSFVEGRILEIEEIMKNAIIAKNNTNKDQVNIGSKVEVEFNGKNIVFEIVGELESDPINKKLSSKSPIGQALIYKKIGDNVEVTTPAGKNFYKIVNIQ